MKPNNEVKAWSKADRKASAIAEFTLRQYKQKISTWVILGVSVVALMLLMLFYIDSMNQEIEPVDNDGDSFDSDGDGYPDGQERLYGTNEYSRDDNPGNFDPPIAPDDPSKWINEDDFEWDQITGNPEDYVGNDDDGDCLNANIPNSQKNQNDNTKLCDVEVSPNRFVPGYSVNADINVDEDPDEERYIKEAVHRAYVLGYGKMALVFIIGIFVPLFLATGLIRQEMTSGTMHFMIAKPIARGEIYLYRLLGYLGVAWPIALILVVISALITGFVGPGDGFFRFQDLRVWLAILIATWMAMLVYGALFSALGVMWKYGIILAIPFAAWELGMGFLSMGLPESPLLKLSVIGWCMAIIDSASIATWPELPTFTALGSWGGGGSGEFGIWGFSSSLPGSDVLDYIGSSPPFPGLAPMANVGISILVLLIQVATIWLIAQSIFKGKEIE